MKLNGKLSQSFCVEREVKQDTVLSPALFLLVMDPLLRKLQSSGLGLSVKQFYTGGFLHADDIRSSEESIDRQVALVKTFAEDKLNVNKCEIVLFSRDVISPACMVEGSVIPASDEGKCLGYWWRGNLLATKSVYENREARSAFFHYGSIGVFQGDICPLSQKMLCRSRTFPT